MTNTCMYWALISYLASGCYCRIDADQHEETSGGQRIYHWRLPQDKHTAGGVRERGIVLKQKYKGKIPWRKSIVIPL